MITLLNSCDCSWPTITDIQGAILDRRREVNCRIIESYFPAHCFVLEVSDLKGYYYWRGFPDLVIRTLSEVSGELRNDSCRWFLCVFAVLNSIKDRISSACVKANFTLSLQSLAADIAKLKSSYEPLWTSVRPNDIDRLAKRATRGEGVPQ